MDILLSDDSEKKYNRLKRFLSQPKETGYCFATAVDQRLIPIVSNRLKVEIPSVSILFLADSDTPFIQQIEDALENHSGVLIMNLSELIKKRTSFVNTFNYTRESLIELNKPIVFWVTDNALVKISNQAHDLYSQRLFTNIRFEQQLSEPSIKDLSALNNLDDSVEFDSNIKLNESSIRILEKQLSDSSGSKEQIAQTIGLPLAKKYAENGQTEEALNILQLYYNHLNLLNDSIIFDIAEIYRLTYSYEDAITHYQRALHFAKSKHLEAICYERLGAIYSNEGKINLALEAFEKAVKILEELYKEFPNQVSFKNDLAISYSKLGGLNQAMGNLPNALEFFQKYNQLCEELHKDYPNQVDFKNGLAISYEKLGDLNQAMGNLTNALAFFQKRNKLGEELYKDFPNQVDFKKNLAISYSRLGDLNQAMGNLTNALEYFQKYNQLCEELHKDYPNQVDFKRGLAISYSRLGNLNQAMGNLTNALEFFQKYNQLCEELYKDHPNQVSFKNGLAISYERLGDLNQAMGNLTNALEFFQKYNQLCEELYKDFPNQVDFKNNLAISYEKLGELNQTMGNLTNALDFFQKETNLFHELYRDYPNQVSFKNGLAISYSKLGTFYKSTNSKEAFNYYKKAEKLWSELVEAVPQAKEYQNNLNWAQNALNNLNTP
ncbi:tetratricopeptide repeat protein [Emticicia sp. 21SJ11W-3]|uniref:tetratricopeptide repeat protein n=1 Tax=Emticicia sp. 21SJ11W-3 TaxID=2916755 RepID=UPI00209F70B0|nr:tetratricopeptide repeat protein [Emticicia sp. 21SJ11W-3]UTA69573.1 tetratricopeptide repeat protein [Emticicia sp. 21SJ11W-3]